MLRKLFATLIVVLLLLLGTTIVLAKGPQPDEFYPWLHHAPPFDFKFGAMIDSHQQSQVNGAGILQGFIYIQLTGETTADGTPVAKKAHCSSGTCSLGWVIKGEWVTATLVQTAPRVWLVDPEDLPKEPGYTHFQWFGPPKTPHELVVGTTYTGYLLKRIASKPFYWLGGGGGSGGSGGDTGGCDGHDGDDGGDTGGCSGHDGEDTGDTGGCGGHGGDTGGSSGGSGGSDGRLVSEGVDPHSNIVTVWDGTWTGGCGGHDGGDTGGCDGHDGGSCEGH